MSDFVTVECTLPQGITIDCGVPGEDYAWTHVPGPSKGKYGSARVPKTTWDAWLKANAKSRLVRDKCVRLRK